MDSVITAYLAAVAVPGSAQPSTLALITEADLVVQFVLVSLVAMSIGCWVILINKGLLLRNAAKQSTEFLDLFWNSRRLDQVYEKAGDYPQSPIAEVFKAGYVELHKLTQNDEAGGQGQMDLGGIDNLIRALRRAASTELTSLERMIPFLATTGSTAPFIGLFGTVWGIMNAFRAIAASQNTNLSVVAPGITEALFATALGLIAAIPALVFYNMFTSDLDKYGGRLEGYSDELSAILSRKLSKGA